MPGLSNAFDITSVQINIDIVRSLSEIKCNSAHVRLLSASTVEMRLLPGNPLCSSISLSNSLIAAEWCQLQNNYLSWCSVQRYSERWSD